MKKLYIFLTTLIILANSFVANAQNYPDSVIAAINTALDDEYKAYTTYQAYINHFGQIRPFSNIINSELRHIEALSDLLIEQNLEVPANPYDESMIDIPTTISKACQIAVEAEIANKDLYFKQLIPEAESFANVKIVFENLANASQDRHLPAFKRCANR